MANKEKWREVVGYDRRYSVSDRGRVRSDSKYIRQSVGNHGYLVVNLCSPLGARKQHLVHRLISEAFLANDFGRRTVNHKDGTKTNNLLNNLEWATDSENHLHAYKNGLNRNGGVTMATGIKCKAFKRAIQADSGGRGVVMFGNKQMEDNGFDPVGVWRCLNGLRKTHRGCVISAISGGI